MKKILILTFITTLLSISHTHAQQDPQYTQYMYNMIVVNPAYAGLKDGLSLNLLYRDQWSGLDGAPTTFTFSGHTPVGEKTALGLSVIKDELGPVNETNAYADFSYRLDFKGSWHLA